MCVYRRVCDSRHLQADCQEPGSAAEPYARQSSTDYRYLVSAYRWLSATYAAWLQTLHTLRSADVAAVAERATLPGRLRYSLSQAIVRQPVNVPAEMRVHVTVCDLLHSRKMVLYTAVMCSLW